VFTEWISHFLFRVSSSIRCIHLIGVFSKFGKIKAYSRRDSIINLKGDNNYLCLPLIGKKNRIHVWLGFVCEFFRINLAFIRQYLSFHPFILYLFFLSDKNWLQIYKCSKNAGGSLCILVNHFHSSFKMRK
jgi:hypothetical protein